MRIARLLLVVCGCFLALACGNKGSESSSNVMMMHYFTGSLSSGIAELATAVNRENPGYQLAPTPLEHESFKSTIRHQLEGPNPPDLFSYWAGAKTRNLVEHGTVQSLESLFGTEIPAGTFSPAVQNALVYHGKPYMIPITQHYVGFFYNTKIFRDAGVAVPKTWEQFLKVCARLKDRGVNPLALGALNRWPAQFWLDYLLLRESGFSWRQDLMEGRNNYDSPPVKQAFKRWKELFDAKYFNVDAATLDWDPAAMQVVQGTSAMTLNGTWLIGGFTDRGYKYPDDYGFFAFPELGSTGEKVALGPIDGVMMAVGGKHQAAARKILARMARVEVQETFSLAAGSISPHRAAVVDRLPPLQRQIKLLVDSSTHWAFNFDLATSPERSEIGLNELLAFVRQPLDVDALLADWDKKLADLGK